jgi:hypothetical protein
MTAAIDMKAFRGAFLIHQSTAPRARHQSFSAAEAEAARLLEANPDASFIISQEVARVKRGPQGARS